MDKDYEGYPGDPEALLSSGDPGEAEVLVRGPAASVAAIRVWLEQRARDGGYADARTVEDPERAGGLVCRMLIVPPECGRC